MDHHFAWSSVLVEVGPIRHARFAGAARDRRLVRHEQFGAAALVQRAGGAGGVLFDRAQSPAEPSYVFAKTLLELVPPCGDTRCFLGREGAEQQVAIGLRVGLDLAHVHLDLFCRVIARSWPALRAGAGRGPDDALTIGVGRGPEDVSKPSLVAMACACAPRSSRADARRAPSSAARSVACEVGAPSTDVGRSVATAAIPSRASAMTRTVRRGRRSCSTATAGERSHSFCTRAPASARTSASSRARRSTVNWSMFRGEGVRATAQPTSRALRPADGLDRDRLGRVGLSLRAPSLRRPLAAPLGSLPRALLLCWHRVRPPKRWLVVRHARAQPLAAHHRERDPDCQGSGGAEHRDFKE